MSKSAKPSRSIALVRPRDEHGIGILRIDFRGKSDFYIFLEIRCDIGGRGFIVHRLGLGSLYHVRVGAPDECSCECLGFLRWNRCKHVEGLRALISRGMI